MRQQIIFDTSQTTYTTNSVQSICKSTYASGFSTPEHIHDAAQILYISDGTLCLNIKHQSIQLHKNDILIIFKNIPHSSIALNDCTFYTLNINFVPENIENFPILKSVDYLNTLCQFSLRYRNFMQFKPSSDVISHIQNIFSEFYSQKVYWKELSQLYSYSLLLLVFRELQFSFVQRDIYINTHFISALEYLNSNYMNKIAVTDIAEHCNVSARYLNTLFQTALETSLSHFIVSFRIDKAIELILEKTFTLSEIAVNVGFSSLQHFSKTFKNELGLSPKSYQTLVTSMRNHY